MKPLSDAERARLRRAVRLDVERTGRDAWTVTGGAEPHRVMRDGDRLECDCADRLIRPHRCKHMIAVALSRGHRVVLDALRSIVPAEGAR